jgi:hypothetical protein
MGVMWVDGEVWEGEGYFSHLDFQSGYTGRHASASALGFGFAGRTNGSVPTWARGICASGWQWSRIWSGKAYASIIFPGDSLWHFL